MLDHISITVPSMQIARPFYLAVMQALDIPLVGEEPDWLGFGLRADAAFPQRSYLSIRQSTQWHPDALRHWCFKATSRLHVDRFHAAGLLAGGKDDGMPGLRADYHACYYGAFLIDPAGNRIEAVCHDELATS